MSKSDSGRSKSRSPQEKTKEKPKLHKLFVTGLDGQASSSKLEEDLKELFSNYGQIHQVITKRSFNREYSFAFIEYAEAVDGNEAVQALNGSTFQGKKIKVQIQDIERRRKNNATDGCFKCGKSGHFARQCKDGQSSHRSKDRRREDSRSRSKSREHKRKSRKQRSPSSESRHHKKKQTKRKSKSRSNSRSKSHKRHSKKHRKQRRHSDSS